MAKHNSRRSFRTPSTRQVPGTVDTIPQPLHHNHNREKELLEISFHKRYTQLVKHGYELLPVSGSAWEVPMGARDYERHISSKFQEMGTIVAKRAVDNTLVAIKRVDRDTVKREGIIVKRLARARDTDAPNGPQAFLVEALSGAWPVMRMPALEDPLDRGWYLSVSHPEFWQPIEKLWLLNFGDVVDFISQTSEGLAFMHRNGVTHGGICTCTTGCIMFEEPHWQQAMQRARMHDGRASEC
ncbi:hypothetical protein C8Q80DRAFT_331519 [Daedaleopsis nitida]|nr:hypothetical protein C8Q80DRAFT_331519 [Daedaleopsis nitida]